MDFSRLKLFVHTGQTNKTDRLDFTIRLHVCLLRHTAIHTHRCRNVITYNQKAHTHTPLTPWISFPETHVRYGVYHLFYGN